MTRHELSPATNARETAGPSWPAGIAAPPVALTIAGFDPSSGAGITADLKTFSAHGLYGVACISALTVQSTLGVRSVEPVAPQLVRQTLDYLSEDLSLAGVKIGMLASAGIVAEVARFLRRWEPARRGQAVLDPVVHSSSGMPLLDDAGVRLLLDDLLGCVGWITPNLAELAILTGAGTITRAEVPAAARRLRARAAQLENPALNVVVTGGHLPQPDDYVLLANGEEFWLSGEPVVTNATHGTGCAFSSALLAALITGESHAEAARSAKAYVAGALRAAYPLGKGRGPLNHLYPLRSK